MIVWALLAVYATGYLWTWRTATYVLAADLSGPTITGEELAFGLFVGAIISLFWPVVAPLYIAWSHDLAGKPLLLRFARTPARERRTQQIERLEREAREREARIKRLERELGVAKDSPTQVVAANADQTILDVP